MMDSINKNLKKSGKLLRINLSLFLISISISLFVRPFLKENMPIVDILIGIPILIMFILGPIGLFYSWRSHKNKEGTNQTRFKQFFGHGFVCLFLFVLVFAIIVDLSRSSGLE